MYSHARMSSILRRYEASIPDSKFEGDLVESEIELIRTMAKWPKTVESAVDKLAIHIIPNYVHQLSSKFNNFYRDCKVIGDTNEALRINLVNSSKRILYDALDILGVEAPDRM